MTKNFTSFPRIVRNIASEFRSIDNDIRNFRAGNRDYMARFRTIEAILRSFRAIFYPAIPPPLVPPRSAYFYDY